MPEPPIDPPDLDTDEPPQFCLGCGLPIGDQHGCECVRLRVPIPLEDA